MLIPKSELLGRTCPGRNIAGHNRPLSTPCVLRPCLRVARQAVGYLWHTGGFCAGSKSQEAAESVVVSLEASFEGGKSRTWADSGASVALALGKRLGFENSSDTFISIF